MVVRLTAKLKTGGSSLSLPVEPATLNLKGHRAPVIPGQRNYEMWVNIKRKDQHTVSISLVSQCPKTTFQCLQIVVDVHIHFLGSNSWIFYNFFCQQEAIDLPTIH